MNNIIYIGSTNIPNVFHVGMTSNNRSPYLRWKDTDYRGKLPYLPQKVEFYSVGDLRDEPVHQYIQKDSKITNLHDEGISSDEIFRVDSDNPVEYITNLVEEAISYNKTGIRPIDKFYVPRPHQQWVNDQILSKFDGVNTLVQPLNLCPRFGKTPGALDLFKRTGFQTMIIAGYWLSANQSFVSTVESKFDITSDVTVIDPDYDSYVAAISTGNRVLIDLSLHTDEDNIDDRLLSVLNETNSLIYIDEADFGAWTKSSRAVANKFIESGINIVCVATGTNIDRALIGSTHEVEEPINVSYIDLIEAKRGEGRLFDPGELCHDDPQTWISRLEDIVDVACLSLDANKCLVDDLNDLTDEKRPNMAKIFAKRNSHIQTEIIKQLLYDVDGLGEDVFGLYATEYGSIEKPAVMMFIPGTKADVNNITKIGKSIAPEYNWIALHGDDYTNRVAEQKVLQAINSGGERTVIVSCSMGARSFSVPNIIAVINCIDGGSVGTAVQRSSRVLTPGLGKKVGLVVNYSFNTDRSSSFETDLISSALNYDVNDIESSIRRVYGLVNFYRKDSEGYLIQLTESEFTNYVTCPANLENMAAATIDMEGILSHKDLLSILSNVDSMSMSKEWKGSIEKAITYIKKEREKGEKNEEQSDIRDLIKKVQSIIQTTSNVHYLAPMGDTFTDCLETISNDENKNEEYKNLVGVHADVVLNNLVEYLPIKFMNLIVTKTSNSKTYSHFHSQYSGHRSGLFNV